MNTLLITGANRGIGLEMAKQYAEDGWRVFACHRASKEPYELNKLKQQNNKIITLALDVASVASINTLTQQIADTPIDILINNAGVWGGKKQSFGAIEAEAWIDALKVNTLAPLLIAQALIDNITQSKLKIIANISSVMGSIELNLTGSDYIYRSAKAALNAITKSMAIDLKEKEVKVVALHPGWVKTDMGGPNAQITPAESVNSIKNILNKLSFEDSGKFLNYDKNKLAW